MSTAMKRLCCIAVAFFMVLSMTPATTLLASAAEELPTGIALGTAVKNHSAEVKDLFANATGEVTAVCPVCKANGDATAKNWTPIKSDVTIKDKVTVVSMGGGHFYFAENLNVDYSYVLGGFFGGSGCLNLNGKSVTLNGGKLVELTAGNTMNIMDTFGGAEVTGSVDQYGNDGKTLRIKEDTAVLNLFGGTYKAMNDTYTAYGSDTDKADGSATVAVRGGTLNMYEGATIVGVDGTTGNTSKYGGAVYVNNANNPVFNMYGGTIKDGVSSEYGGNVCVYSSKATFNMYAGEIMNGNAKYGGNVYVHSYSETSFGTMKMYCGFIANGKASNVNYGNNVYLGTYKSNDVTYCTAVFEMSGGTIVGNVCGGYGTSGNRSVNLSGSAKIVIKAMHNGQLYTAAAGLVRCTFDSTKLGEGSDIWLNQGLGESRMYCPACKNVAKWTAISAPQAMTAGGHYRLKADVAYTYETDSDNSFLSGTGCFDLYGCDLTIDGGRFLLADKGTVNIFDTFGGAVVTGSNDYYSEGGLTIRTNAANAVVNLNGGTYKGMEDTATTEGRENSNSPLVRMRAGGELNLYPDATIDGSDLRRTCATIFIGYNASTPTTFNIVGGTVIGGTNTNADGVGGAFRVGNAAGDATLNLISGKIVGGNAKLGDAVCVRPGNTFNMKGGLVVGGENGTGRVVYLGKNATNETGATANLSGGVVVGELYAEEFAAVTVSGKASIVTSYEDYTAARALTLKQGAILNIDALDADAKIVLSNAGDYLHAGFTVASENAAVAKNAFTVADRYRVTVNEENQLMITNPAAGVQTTEDDAVWFDTTEEAVAAYDFDKDQVLVLFQDATINGNVYLDARNEIAVTGTGHIYGIDRTNDSLQAYNRIAVAEGITVETDVIDPIYGNRYIAVKEEDGYGFHRLTVELTNVTLRTTKAGIYYKAAIACDDVLKNEIASYGVAVSVVGMPTAAFENEENVAYTSLVGAPSGTFTSGSVFNIFRSSLSAEKNAARGAMKIYANPYLKLNDGTVLMAQEGASRSMQDVMNYLNTNFETLDADVQAQAKSFYATWADAMATWNLDKLAATETV